MESPGAWAPRASQPQNYLLPRRACGLLATCPCAGRLLVQLEQQVWNHRESWASLATGLSAPFCVPQGSGFLTSNLSIRLKQELVSTGSVPGLPRRAIGQLDGERSSHLGGV